MVRARLNGQHVTYATLADANPNQIRLIYELQEYGRLGYAVEEHAAIVSKQALRRRLEAAATGLADRARDPRLEADKLIDEARSLVDVAVGAQRRPVRFLRDILPGVVNSISEDGTQFVASPWPSLDVVIGGFRPGCVYVIGGRPAQGKSVLAGQCAVALAKHGLVAFASLEMSEEELTARFVSERIPLSISRIKDGTMSSADWVRFAERKRRIDELPVAVDDRANVTVADIRQHARNVSRRGSLAGIVIDYLQLVRGDNPRADRREQIGAASRQIKVMAKDLRVPVIVLSQLNRDPEKRSDGRPRLVDLRESGDIEQDADAVLLIYRHGEIVGTERREAIDLNVAKNRHGIERNVQLRWEGALSRATEWPDEKVAADPWSGAEKGWQ
jgi:replicative DNA helicase